MLVSRSVGGLSEMPTTWRQDKVATTPATAATPTAPAHRRKIVVDGITRAARASEAPAYLHSRPPRREARREAQARRAPLPARIPQPEERPTPAATAATAKLTVEASAADAASLFNLSAVVQGSALHTAPGSLCFAIAVTPK